MSWGRGGGGEVTKVNSTRKLGGGGRRKGALKGAFQWRGTGVANHRWRQSPELGRNARYGRGPLVKEEHGVHWPLDPHVGKSAAYCTVSVNSA